MVTTAFLDANVLYPAELRSFLLYVSATGAYRALWSDMVHEEWISNLLANRPDLDRAKLERTRALMDQHVDALVTGFEHRIDEFHLPDPDDRHVLAAAIHGEADVIVTMNTRDFPALMLGPWMVVMTPDAFLMDLWETEAAAITAAAATHRGSLRRPAKTPAEYLAMLERQGLVRMARALADAETQQPGSNPRELDPG